MAGTPVEVLMGISYGLLLGSVTSLGTGTLVAVVRLYADRSVPQSVVAAVSLVGFGAFGTVVGVLDVGADQTLSLAISALVVLLLALYAHSLGERLAEAIPRRTAQTTERNRTLAADAIDAIDAVGHVTIRSTGDVRDVDGYPSLPPSVRVRLERDSWRLPADLPLAELESRLQARLRTAYDLHTVEVSIDGRGRATIAASPATKGVASRVPDGWRAASIRALLPTDLAPGDEVRVETDGETVAGTVLDTTTAAPTEPADCGERDRPRAPRAAPDGGGGAHPASSGGDGRVTVAVPTSDAGALVDADRGRVVVTPGETTAEFDALSLLERAGTAARKVVVDEELKATLTDEASDVWLFALRGAGERADGSPDGWQFGPEADAAEAGDRAFVVGDQHRLARFGLDEPNAAAAMEGR